MIAIGFGAGTWGRIWLATSPRFEIAELSVTGTERLAVGELVATMGLQDRANIFAVDLAKLERSLEAHPWVRDARVERRLPDRLLIEISEQRAAAIAQLGGLYLIDEQGAPFKRAATELGETRGLFVITGISRDDYSMSKQRAHTRFRRAMDLASVYHDAPERPVLGEIHLDERHGTTLFSRDSAMAIRIGSGTPAEQIARLGAFDAAWTALSEAEQQSALVIHANRDTTPQRVSVAFSQSR